MSQNFLKYSLFLVFFCCFGQWAFAQHVAVVVPASFRSALEPWLEYRSQQGYEIHLIEPNAKTTVEEIRGTLQQLSNRVPLAAVLLVGDGSHSHTETVPVPLVRARVIGEFGPHQWIASDNVYADLDGDELPDIAVGRFSVKTPRELTAIVRKTTQYEQHQTPHPSQRLASRRINVVAGVGGFSPLIDRTIESSARHILSRTIPPEYEITLTQADVGSPYCPAPNQFRYETIARLNEGPLFWVYIGHGTTQALDYLHLPQKSLPIFAPGDSQFVSCQRGLPIALFLACLTGELDAEHDCLAEELHRLTHGPVAVIASSRTSMPYGMSVLGIELVDEIFNRTDGSVLLGTAILNAKRRSMSNLGPQSLGPQASSLHLAGKMPADPGASRSQNIRERPLREVVDSLAKTLDPTSDRLEHQRLDHLHLFHLFGDPLLRLPQPSRITLDAPATAKPDSVITVRGQIDRKMQAGSLRTQGRAVIELAVPKSRATVSAPKNRVFRSTPESVEEFNALYLKSNNSVVARTAVELSEQSPNVFEAELRIPKFQRGEKGSYDLCVYMESETEFALGSRSILIK